MTQNATRDNKRKENGKDEGNDDNDFDAVKFGTFGCYCPPCRKGVFDSIIVGCNG